MQSLHTKQINKQITVISPCKIFTDKNATQSRRIVPTSPKEKAIFLKTLPIKKLSSTSPFSHKHATPFHSILQPLPSKSQRLHKIYFIILISHYHSLHSLDLKHISHIDCVTHPAPILHTPPLNIPNDNPLSIP